jgi:hypothetical protein
VKTHTNTPVVGNELSDIEIKDYIVFPCVCSRMQKTPVLFPTGGSANIPSGHLRQNLFFDITSFDRPSWTLLISVCVRVRSISRVLEVFHMVSCVRFKYYRPSISDGMSFHNVWRYFSPEMHKNFHSGATTRASSLWISRQQLHFEQVFHNPEGLTQSFFGLVI